MKLAIFAALLAYVSCGEEHLRQEPTVVVTQVPKRQSVVIVRDAPKRQSVVLIRDAPKTQSVVIVRDQPKVVTVVAADDDHHHHDDAKVVTVVADDHHHHDDIVTLVARPVVAKPVANVETHHYAGENKELVYQGVSRREVTVLADSPRSSVVLVRNPEDDYHFHH